jgi:hypothetical protein
MLKNRRKESANPDDSACHRFTRPEPSRPPLLRLSQDCQSMLSLIIAYKPKWKVPTDDKNLLVWQYNIHLKYQAVTFYLDL